MEERSDGFLIFRQTDGGQCLRIEGGREGEYLNYWLEHRDFGINLTRMFGFDYSCMDYLKKFKGLKRLHIQDEVADVRSIESLADLEWLLLAEYKGSLDLHSFPKLKTFRGLWSRGLVGLDSSSGLQHLYLSKFNPASRDFSSLSDVKTLKSVEVVRSTVTSSNGVQDLQSLSTLSLGYCSKLEDVSALGRCGENLLEVEFDHCKKIGDYSVLGALTNLRTLKIFDSAPIKNLAFLAKLPDLEFLSISRTRIEDGDLQHVLNLKKISHFYTDNIQCYQPKAIDVIQEVKSRSG